MWNPAALIDTASDSRRNYEPSGMGHYELGRLPSGVSKYEDGVQRRDGPAAVEKYPPLRVPPGLSEPSTFLADLERSTQSFFSQQRASLPLSSQYELESAVKSSSTVLKSLQGHGGHIRHGPGLGVAESQGVGLMTTLAMGPDSVLIYDEFLQQHRKPVSKLDLEEKRRKEAREKGSHWSPANNSLLVIDASSFKTNTFHLVILEGCSIQRCNY